MTDEPLHKEIEEKELKAPANVPSKNNRRRLLKGAIAVPVVMTLHSGAALARTSNLVGQVTELELDMAATQDIGNGEQLVCALPDPSQDQTDAPPFDLGDAPMGHLEPNIDAGNNPISLEQQAINCQTNRGGIMISATALSSIQNGVGITINSDVL